jgi:photosystem II stability/assembly factor-like uncharacterized protein
MPNLLKSFVASSLSAVLLAAMPSAAAQGPRLQLSHTTESFRGVSAVSRQVAWASGTHGTYLRTIDGGLTWIPAQVPDASALDFRAVAAFSADEAFLLSAGPGDQSRIYHTTDAGQHWQLQFTNTNPKGFFDSMVFWDPKHGIVLGDPIPDDKGQLKFELLITDDGETWYPIPPSQLPPAIEGEGAFAASNSCIAILQKNAVAVARSVIPSPKKDSAMSDSPNNVENSARNNVVIPSEARNLLFADATAAAHVPNQPSAQPWNSAASEPHFDTWKSAASEPRSAPNTTWKSGASAPREMPKNDGASAPDPNIWFATGGRAARVFHSPDRGQTWQVFDAPILHGPDSAGIFSIAFRDALHGVIAGGDYKHPKDDGPNLAFTSDGGKTWTLSPIHPQAYFSAVAYDQRVNQAAIRQENSDDAKKESGKKVRIKPTAPERLFIIGTDFLFDFRPPLNPRRVGGNKKLALAFNAVAAYPEGGALIVGSKGTIAFIP